MTHQYCLQYLNLHGTRECQAPFMGLKLCYGVFLLALKHLCPEDYRCNWNIPQLCRPAEYQPQVLKSRSPSLPQAPPGCCPGFLTRQDFSVHIYYAKFQPGIYYLLRPAAPSLTCYAVLASNQATLKGMRRRLISNQSNSIYLKLPASHKPIPEQTRDTCSSLPPKVQTLAKDIAASFKKSTETLPLSCSCSCCILRRGVASAYLPRTIFFSGAGAALGIELKRGVISTVSPLFSETPRLRRLETPLLLP